MKKFLQNNTGRLRLIALLEGVSLILLVFIAVPLKYIWEIPQGSQILGPIHGALFVLFVIWTIIVADEKNWSFFRTTLPVLISSFIPFGTFYADKKFLQR